VLLLLSYVQHSNLGCNSENFGRLLTSMLVPDYCSIPIVVLKVGDREATKLGSAGSRPFDMYGVTDPLET